MPAQSEDHRYWRIALVVFGTISLASGLSRSPGFWSSYALDLFGPAWIYILIRGLFSRTQPAMLSSALNPEAALLLVAAACFLIEGAQYLGFYDAHYDPYDLLAYLSLLVPCYAIDRWLLNRRSLRYPLT